MQQRAGLAKKLFETKHQRLIEHRITASDTGMAVTDRPHAHTTLCYATNAITMAITDRSHAHSYITMAIIDRSHAHSYINVHSVLVLLRMRCNLESAEMRSNTHAGDP